MWFVWRLAVAIGASWYAYEQGKWRWWIFLLAAIPCAIFAQFRAGMTAELSGMTGYATARPGQVMFWSIVFGSIYAAIITAVIGFVFVSGRY